MDARELIDELENTETMRFQVEHDDHGFGVGASFFSALGEFNETNNLGIKIRVECPVRNRIDLIVFGENAEKPLKQCEANQLLDFFESFFPHSYGREEFVHRLKEKGKWPEKQTKAAKMQTI